MGGVSSPPGSMAEQKKGRSIMETVNSRRVANLERRWQGQNITIEALCYLLKLLDLVQDSPTLKGSARKQVFKEVWGGFIENRKNKKRTQEEATRIITTPEEEREALKKFLECLLKDYEPSEERLYISCSFVFHGCEYALETSFDSDTNDKIEKLLKTLESIAPEEKIV